MAQEKPVYEVVEDFPTMAEQIVEKYPTFFGGIDVTKVRCVKISNKERPKAKQKPYDIQAVKMPVLMDAPYGWYVTVWGDDWDAYSENQKLVLIADILRGIPIDADEEGKVVPCDIKGYGIMFRTFGSVDYLDDPNLPNIIEENINWVKDREDVVFDGQTKTKADDSEEVENTDENEIVKEED